MPWRPPRKARAEKTHDLNAGAGDAFARIGDTDNKHGAALQEGTQTMARSARNTLSSVTSNPFALGAIAAVVGAVAGALIPTLDEEEAALGSVAAKVRTAGRDLAQDVVDRGGRVANETLAAVKDSADAHGLTSRQAGRRTAQRRQIGRLGRERQAGRSGDAAGGQG